MQVDPRIIPTKDFFFFQTSTFFFHCFLGVFQDWSEDYIGEDDIDMIQVIVV